MCYNVYIERDMTEKNYQFTVLKANPKWLHKIDMSYDCPGCGREFKLAEGFLVEHHSYVCSELCADFYILQIL
jgi:hypothetical protein